MCAPWILDWIRLWCVWEDVSAHITTDDSSIFWLSHFVPSTFFFWFEREINLSRCVTISTNCLIFSRPAASSRANIRKILCFFCISLCTCTCTYGHNHRLTHLKRVSFKIIVNRHICVFRSVAAAAAAECSTWIRYVKFLFMKRNICAEKLNKELWESTYPRFSNRKQTEARYLSVVNNGTLAFENKSQTVTRTKNCCKCLWWCEQRCERNEYSLWMREIHSISLCTEYTVYTCAKLIKCEYPLALLVLVFAGTTAIAIDMTVPCCRRCRLTVGNFVLIIACENVRQINSHTTECTTHSPCVISASQHSCQLSAFSTSCPLSHRYRRSNSIYLNADCVNILM